MSSQAVGENFTVNWSRDIHKFILHGTRILLDVNSGSVHIVDAAAWDVLEALEQCWGNVQEAKSALNGKYPPGQIAEIIEEFVSLQRQGMLFTDDSLVESWTRQPGCSEVFA